MYRLKVKEYRKLRNMTQKDLAAKVGISQSSLSEIENRKYDVGISLIDKIGKVLNISPHKLIEFY